MRAHTLDSAECAPALELALNEPETRREFPNCSRQSFEARLGRKMLILSKLLKGKSCRSSSGPCPHASFSCSPTHGPSHTHGQAGFPGPSGQALAWGKAPWPRAPGSRSSSQHGSRTSALTTPRQGTLPGLSQSLESHRPEHQSPSSRGHPKVSLPSSLWWLSRPHLCPGEPAASSRALKMPTAGQTQAQGGR